PLEGGRELGGRRASLRLVRERRGENGVERSEARRRDLARERARHGLELRRRTEQERAREHLPHNAAEREHVRRRSSDLAGVLLGCHVTLLAEEPRRSLVRDRR